MYKGLPISDDAITELLDMLPSNKTGGRVGALPLVLGMPVVITENFNVAGGVVNGNTSILCHVHYCLGDDGKRYLTSCVIELPDFTGGALPHLPPQHVPVIVEQAVVYSTLPQEYSTLTFRGEGVAEDGGVEERSEVMYCIERDTYIYYKKHNGHSCIA